MLESKLVNIKSIKSYVQIFVSYELAVSLFRAGTSEIGDPLLAIHGKTKRDRSIANFIMKCLFF